MANRIRTLLLPLDGSKQAEVALDYVKALAPKLDAEVILLRAALAQTAPGTSASTAQREMTRVVSEAKAYLSQAEQLLQADSVTCRSVVPYGAPADSIIDNAEFQRADLVVMSAHGRSGPSRWNHGGVADKVVQGLGKPVIIVQGQPSASPNARILVPLDGSELAEAILDPLADLARNLGRGITLMSVLSDEDSRCRDSEPVGRAPLAAAIRSPRADTMVSYLVGIAGRLHELGVDARAEVREGSPADEILKRAGRCDVLSVAISAHGLSGVGRWAFGSVAAKILHQANRPVLLFRDPGARLRNAQPARAHRCHNCGRQVYRQPSAANDLCPLCGFALRVCANCEHFDGVVCDMENPWNGGPYAGNPCADFAFRLTQCACSLSRGS